MIAWGNPKRLGQSPPVQKDSIPSVPTSTLSFAEGRTFARVATGLTSGDEALTYRDTILSAKNAERVGALTFWADQGLMGHPLWLGGKKLGGWAIRRTP